MGYETSRRCRPFPKRRCHEPRNSAHDASEDEEHQPDVPAERTYVPFVRSAEVDQAVAPNRQERDEYQPRQPPDGTCRVHGTSMRRFRRGSANRTVTVFWCDQLSPTTRSAGAETIVIFRVNLASDNPDRSLADVSASQSAYATAVELLREYQSDNNRAIPQRKNRGSHNHAWPIIALRSYPPAGRTTPPRTAPLTNVFRPP